MAKYAMNEQQITNYLLGNLPENEIERLDEISVTDDEFTERLRAVEDDLIDSYVRGELSGETLESFKLQYLASPKRREKILFAQTFTRVLDRSPILQEKSSFKSKPPESRPFKVSRLLQWAVAAALILATGYLAFENMNLRNQMQKTLSEQQSLQQREQELLRQLAQQQASDSETKTELARVQKRLLELEQQSAKTPPSETKLIAMNLLPQTRSVRKIPVLTLQDRESDVLFTLELEVDDFPAYEAVLKHPATNDILWRSGKLPSNKKKNSVEVRISANLLKTQSYVWELSGITESGSGEIVATYPFRVGIQ